MTTNIDRPQAIPAKQPQPVVVIEPAKIDLDAQILEAERRVVARDHRVRHNLQVIGGRAKASLSMAGIATAAAAGVVGAVWLVGRGARRIPAVQAVAPKVKRRASFGLVRAVAFLWPLLPFSVKTRASSALVRSVFSMGSPLLKRGRLTLGKRSDG